VTAAVPRPLAEALRTGALVAGTPLPIAVRKYDGRHRFVVETVTLATTPTMLVARGEAGRRFITAGGTAHLPTVTLEYFPAGRWYNVLSYFEPTTGALERHFCNIIAPAMWDGATLSYIDLDLDLVVSPTGVVTVEDVGDFRRNARRWRYPAAVRRGALAALREVRDLAARGVPPFTAEPLAVAAARVLAGGPGIMTNDE
jgi:protein associated with RNAse G/E